MKRLEGGVIVMANHCPSPTGKQGHNVLNEHFPRKIVSLLTRNGSGETKYVASEKQDLYVKLILGQVTRAGLHQKETYLNHATDHVTEKEN